MLMKGKIRKMVISTEKLISLQNQRAKVDMQNFEPKAFCVLIFIFV